MTFIVFFLTFAVILLLHAKLLSAAKKESIRVYEEGGQFPPGSEHLPLLPVATFSLFMGEMKYPHLQLLLESMKWNPTVKFIVIHVIEEGSTQADKLIALKAAVGVPNLQIVAITIPAFSALVNDKLGLTVKMTASWFYKLCDYKPTLGFLFADMIPESDFKYWGFADLDLIWGNFSRFSHLFQGDPRQPFVITGWFRTTGAGAWFINNEDTRTLFMSDSKYVSLLNDIVYHNLDETGTQVEPEAVIDSGTRSISWLMGPYLLRNKESFLNQGKMWKDHLFLDKADAVEWAGPVRWFRGELQVVKGSPEFPPGRDLLFFHRPDKIIGIHPSIQDAIYKEMTIFGYLLPKWIPLSTKYMCRSAGSTDLNHTMSLDHYQPYDHSCFGRVGKRNGH